MRKLAGWLKSLNKRMFFKIFLSSIALITASVVVLTVLFYFGVRNYSKQRINEANLLKLQIIQSNLENQVNDIKTFAVEIANDPRTDGIFAIKSNVRIYDYQSVVKVLDILELFRRTRVMRNYINSIYLYNIDEDIIVSSWGAFYRTEDFYDTSWISLVKDDLILDYYITDVRVPANEDKLHVKPGAVKEIRDDREVLSFIFPVRYLKFKGAIVINVDYEKLFNEMIPVNNPQESFLVTDGNGRIFFDGITSNPEIPLNSAEVINEVRAEGRNSGNLALVSEKETFIAAYGKSSANNLIVVNLIHSDFLFDSLKLINILLIILAAACILFGVIASFLLSKRMYKPITQILNDLQSRILYDYQGKESDLTYINEAVSKLINKDLETENLLHSNQKIMLEAQLLAAIIGNIHSKDFSVATLDDNVACILFAIDDYYKFTQTNGINEQSSYKDIIRYTAQSIADKICKCASIFLDEDKIAMVISLPDERSEEFTGLAKSICTRLNEELQIIKGVSISAAIGELHMGHVNIRRSYLDARKALKYRLFCGKSSIIWHKEIALRNNIFPLDTLNYNHIINYLYAGSRSELMRSIDELIAAMQKNKLSLVTYESTIQVVIQLISKTMDYLTAQHINLADLKVIDNSRSMYLEIMNIDSLDRLKARLVSFFDAIFTYQTNNASSISNKKYVHQAVELVSKNFVASDLSLEKIADTIGISYSYLRKIFKDEIGVNIFDYLNRLRIEQAKKLLLHSDLSIMEIADKSGFSNDQGLTRFFKKYEGITPGKFREFSGKSAG